ncbi:sugar phosphate isomerase/epimerase [uncultured Arcticibacterium sp.]|uniref:sugar phosphate isomerase/epimerase family protein n=1 Tax=uncultured Arcticibacterium sp. TaxID=2173042 RepID=UPI0030F527CC
MNRRDFIYSSSAALIGSLALSSKVYAGVLKPNSLINGVQIGTITYSFRSMPGSAQQVLQYCVDAGISAIELMGDPAEDFAGKPKNPIDRSTFYVNGKRRKPTDDERAQMEQYNKDVAAWRETVSMKPFKAFAKMYKKAGVSIYAFKPNALGTNNTDAEIEYAMRAAKALGAKSVTVELPGDSAQSARLGKLGEKHKMYVGYHLHTTANDTIWDEALAQSPYNSMNLDCGHYIAAGGDNTKESLLKLIETRHDRITSMHIKDRQTKANGASNLAWGEGDTPIKEILNLISEKKYDIPCTIELEYKVPENSNAVKEVGKCFQFAKEALS